MPCERLRVAEAQAIGRSLRPDAYGPYAQYFVKFIKAFEAEGLPIHAVTVQNEPMHAAPFPGMVMTADEQAAFVGRHLGPAFAAAGLDTKILIYDHNWDHPEYPEHILADPEAGPYVAGTAFHRYGGAPDAQSRLHDAYPDKAIYFTEGSTDIHVSFGYIVQTLVIHAIRHWARAVILFNIAADQQNGPYPVPGGCVICRPMLKSSIMDSLSALSMGMG